MMGVHGNVVGMEIWHMPGISEAWIGLTQPEFLYPFLCVGPVFPSLPQSICYSVFCASEIS